MAYTVIKGRAGLAAGEAAVKLSTGDVVGVKVSSVRNPNGSGMTFTVCARRLEAAGATARDATGQTINTAATTSVPAALIDQYGADAFAKEMLLMALGEEPAAHVDIPVDLAAHAAVADQVPDGHTVDPTANRAPLLHLPPTDRLNASIAHAIAVAAQSGVHSATDLL